MTYPSEQEQDDKCGGYVPYREYHETDPREVVSVVVNAQVLEWTQNRREKIQDASRKED